MLTGICDTCGNEMQIDDNGIATHTSSSDKSLDTFDLDADHVPTDKSLDV